MYAFLLHKRRYVESFRLSPFNFNINFLSYIPLLHSFVSLLSPHRFMGGVLNEYILTSHHLCERMRWS